MISDSAKIYEVIKNSSRSGRSQGKLKVEKAVTLCKYFQLAPMSSHILKFEKSVESSDLISVFFHF